MIGVIRRFLSWLLDFLLGPEDSCAQSYHSSITAPAWLA